MWVAAGDIVLVSLREYQDEKGDVILKYSADVRMAPQHPPPMPAAARRSRGLFSPLFARHALSLPQPAPQEARALKAAGEIPEHITINDAAVEPSGGADEAGGFEFGEDSDSSSDGGGGGGGAGKDALDVDAI